MKEYKLEIKRFGFIVVTYESDNIEEILKDFRDSWEESCCEWGAYWFNVYKNNKKLNDDEIMKLYENPKQNILITFGVINKQSLKAILDQIQGE